jgi:hypothetical protein
MSRPTSWVRHLHNHPDLHSLHSAMSSDFNAHFVVAATCIPSFRRSGVRRLADRCLQQVRWCSAAGVSQPRFPEGQFPRSRCTLRASVFETVANRSLFCELFLDPFIILSRSAPRPTCPSCPASSCCLTTYVASLPTQHVRHFLAVGSTPVVAHCSILPVCSFFLFSSTDEGC